MASIQRKLDNVFDYDLYHGAKSDKLFALLRELGYAGSLNDMVFNFLRSEGYEGSIEDMLNGGEVITSFGVDPHSYPYSAKGDGVTDDSAALMAANTAAIEAGTFVRLKPRQYNIASGLTFTGPCKLVCLQGHATFIYDNSNIGIQVDLTGSITGPYSITSIAETDVGSPSSSVDYTDRLTFTTASEAGNFDRHSFAFVGSQDKRAYMGTDSNFAAEIFRVRASDASSGYVDVEGRLALRSGNSTYVYSTSIELYKLPDDEVYIEGIKFLANEDIGGTFSGDRKSCIEIYGAVRPKVIRCIVESAFSRGFLFQQTAEALVDNCEYWDQLSLPGSEGGYGYGSVFFGANFAPIVRDCTGQGGRHMFTTDNVEQSSYSSSQKFRYGDVTWATVLNCVSIGSRGIPFDTHENSHMTTFIGCRSVNALINTVGGDGQIDGGSFQLRGCGDRFINGVCEYGQVGGKIIVTPREMIHPSGVYNSFFRNVGVNNRNTSTVYIVADDTPSPCPEIHVIGNTFGEASRGIDITSTMTGVVKVINNTFYGHQDFTARISSAGTLVSKNNHYDFSGTTGSSERAIVMNNKEAKIRVIFDTLEQGSGGSPDYLVDVVSGFPNDASTTGEVLYTSAYEISGAITGANLLGGNATSITNLKSNGTVTNMAELTDA